MAKPALLAALQDAQLAALSMLLLGDVAAEQGMTVRLGQGAMPIELCRDGLLVMNFADRETAHRWLLESKAENERRKVVVTVAKPVTFTVPGTNVTFTGLEADVFRRHYANRERFLKDGRKNLTPAQKRRLQKKTNAYACKVGLIGKKVKSRA